MMLVRRPLVLLAPAAVLVVALALATNVLPLRQIVAQRQEITDTRSRLDALSAGNVALDAKVAALDTPLEVERLAREQLGYIRPGEQAFVMLDPTPNVDHDTVGPVEASAAPVEPSERSLLDKVWDYMTGRDLAGDV